MQPFASSAFCCRRRWTLWRPSCTLINSCRRAKGIELLVLDFADAFYMLPLVDSEKRYFVAHFNGLFYQWDRIAQGSLNRPTAFGRLSALTARMTQSLYLDSELQLLVYTDDPCAAIRGTPRRIRLMATVLALFWRAPSGGTYLITKAS